MRAILRFLLQWIFTPEAPVEGQHQYILHLQSELSAAIQGHEQFAEVIRERAAEITRLHARIKELEG